MNRDIELRPAGGPLDAVVALPGSKSLTNRALVAAALADGRSLLEGVLLADDTLLMVDALRTLGVEIILAPDESAAQVSGRGGYWPQGEAELFCGNAGTVIRFLTAACCVGLGRYRLDGVPRMRQRPIGELVDALRELGARISYETEEGFCPLTIQASRLRGGTVRFTRPVSSQFISALLLAAPYAARDVMIEVAGGMPSRPYVDLTLAVMEAFGVVVVDDCEGGKDGAARYIVAAPQRYTGVQYRIEPDASAASYFFAAAALTGGRVTVMGLGSGSLQGDLGFVKILARMGCRVEQTDQSTTVHGPPDGRLRGIDADLRDMPDTAQTLAVLAAFAEGPTTIRGIGNLRVKETDRLYALSRELGRMGVETEILGGTAAARSARETPIEDYPESSDPLAGGLVIRPVRPPVAAAIDTWGDHRMAMSFALAGLRLDGVVIRGAECVGKTFPDFFERWERMQR